MSFSENIYFEGIDTSVGDLKIFFKQKNFILYRNWTLLLDSANDRPVTLLKEILICMKEISLTKAKTPPSTSSRCYKFDASGWKNWLFQTILLSIFLTLHFFFKKINK